MRSTTALTLLGALLGQHTAVAATQTQPLSQTSRPELGTFKGYPSHIDQQLGTPTFLWLKNDSATKNKAISDSKTSKKSDKNQLEIKAKQQIIANSRRLGIDVVSATNAKLVALHAPQGGPTIARFQQLYHGKEVFGRTLNVLLDKAQNPIALTGNFAPASQSNALVAEASAVDARQAARLAFREMTGENLSGDLQSQGAEDHRETFTLAGGNSSWQLLGQIRTKSLYFSPSETGSALIPAYQVELRAHNDKEQQAFAFIISAVDGRVLRRHNQLSDVATSYRVWADNEGKHQPYDGPVGNALLPAQGFTPQPVATEIPADQPLVTLEHGPISTNDPWLPEGATETWGNNAVAYIDLGALDGFDRYVGDIMPSMNGEQSFDFAASLSDPIGEEARKAAAVNLFYLVNWLHDDWYDNGLDETSGNAQMDNYGRGGMAGDPIFAEGQDFSGRNNANMYTPSDGSSPVMQMYLFDGVVDGELTLTNRNGLGPYAIGTSDFGPTAYDIQSEVVIGVDNSDDWGEGSYNDGCQTPYLNQTNVAGKIVMLRRGMCDFNLKAQFAQENGAIAVLIADNTDQDQPMSMGGYNPSVTIPSVSITKAAGDTLLAAMDDGPVEVHLRRKMTDRDGTLDNGVIAHEFFHYVSNRLVGDGNGLSNQQARAMGEGWSDVAALLLTVREEDSQVPGNDRFQGPYGIGLHATSNPYFGIRRAPYSTDFSVNPLTFKDIQEGQALPTSAPLAYGQDGEGNSEIHSAGEIWANTLWEFYASLLNDSRYSFDQARERMQDYLIGGLKLTPLDPTFLEARDAILAVVAATDERDWELAAKAFAKRGMGIGAQGPARYSEDLSGVVESFEADAGYFELAETKLDTGFDDGKQGYCSNDGILDAGETARLTLTLNTGGQADLSQPLMARVSSNGDASFANDGLITFPAPIVPGAQVSASTLITLGSADKGEDLQLQINFEPYGVEGVLEPAPLLLHQTVNYGLARISQVDDMETPLASQRQWQTGGVDYPFYNDWALVASADPASASGVNHLWVGLANGYSANTTLTGPVLNVSTSEPLIVEFDHWYSFEEIYQGLGEDGGVVEVSVNGSEFTNSLFLGGIFEEGGYNGAAIGNDYGPAFVGTLNQSGTSSHVRINFGYNLAGTQTRLRFRTAVNESNSTNSPTGWLVDNVAISGTTTPPFLGLVDNAPQCDNRPLHIDAGPDQQVAELDSLGQASLVTLNANLLDRDGIEDVHLRWEQIAGPTVVLDNPFSATPSFNAPPVDDDTQLSFRLTASQQGAIQEDGLTVTIMDTPPPAPTPDPQPAQPQSGGGGALSPLTALLTLITGLLARRRRVPLAPRPDQQPLAK